MTRFLSSTTLTIVLCLLLAAGGIAGSLLYQGNTASGRPSSFNVFRSPFFLLPAALLVLNILFCAGSRLRKMPAGESRTWTFAGLHLGFLLLAAGLLLDGAYGFIGTKYFPVGVPYSGYHNWRSGRDETFPFTVEVTDAQVRFHPLNLQIGVKDAGGNDLGLFVVREGVPFSVRKGDLVVTPRTFDIGRKTLRMDARTGGVESSGLAASVDRPVAIAGYAIAPVAYADPEPSGYLARIRFSAPGRTPEDRVVRTNQPADFDGFSFCITAFSSDRYRNRIVGLQVTREPGAPLFWAGAVLFGVSLLARLLSKYAGAAAMLLLCALPVSAHAFGVVIEREAIWEGEVRVTEPVTVGKGAVLTIRPGTVILLSGEDRDGDGCADGYLQVFGALRVEGEKRNPVRFGPLTPGKPWREVFFKDARAVIRHSVFEGAEWALHIHDGDVRIEETLLRGNGGGARMKGTGAVFTRCAFVGNGVGLRFWEGGPSVSASSIEGNGTGLFYREGTGGGKITGNRIDNREWDVKIGEWARGDLDLSGNYWGMRDAARIADRIRDYRERKDAGRIVWDGPLAGSPPGVPEGVKR